MSYLWQEFNIKTFPAETLVFRNGIFDEDLSSYKNMNYDRDLNQIEILKKSSLPFHIIYVGEIEKDINLQINIKAGNCDVFMTSVINNKKPAFLKIFIKNAGENSVFKGQIISQNYNNLKIDVKGEHLSANTGIFVKTRVLAHENTNSELNGYAIIEKGMDNCENDISFSVMADENAKIKLKPIQYIKSIPLSAAHSASIYKPTESQIIYLKNSGLGEQEVKNTLIEAFLSIE